MIADSSAKTAVSNSLPVAPSIDARKLRQRRILVTSLALTLPLLVSFIYFVWMPGTVLGKTAYSSVKLAMLLAPVVFGLWFLREGVRRPDLSRIPVRRWLSVILPARTPLSAETSVPTSPSPVYRHCALAGIFFGLLVSGFAAALLALPVVGDSLRASGPEIGKQVTAFGVMDYYFLFGIFVAFIHSALEEYYWRGFVFGHLRRLVPLPVAHGLAAIGFAAHHVVVLNQFFPSGIAWLMGGGVALGGLVWSLLYHRYGTLLGAWISHVIVDVAILTIGWQLMHP